MSARIRIFYLEVLSVRNLQNDTEVFCIKRPPNFVFSCGGSFYL